MTYLPKLVNVCLSLYLSSGAYQTACKQRVYICMCTALSVLMHLCVSLAMFDFEAKTSNEIAGPFVRQQQQQQTSKVMLPRCPWIVFNWHYTQAFQKSLYVRTAIAICIAVNFAFECANIYFSSKFYFLLSFNKKVKWECILLATWTHCACGLTCGNSSLNNIPLDDFV